MTCKTLLIRTITPLHVGTGQSVGAIDLPIARERATGWPLIPGSSVKGVLRDAATTKEWNSSVDPHDRESASKEMVRVTTELAETFGTSGGDKDGGYAGDLSTTDQRILLFPVRSFFGTYAYVTSPLAVSRYLENLELAGNTKPVVDLTNVPQDGVALPIGSPLLDGKHVYFDDMDLEAVEVDTGEISRHLATQLQLDQTVLAPRLAIVSDTIFSFLVEHSTEVVTHVALDFVTKTAAKGMLRNEEAVPAEAVFSGLAVSLRGKASTFDALPQSNSPIQFGGKASTGMGLCKFHVVSSE